MVLVPILRSESEPLRDPEARLEEAIGLAMAIGLAIDHAEAITLNQPKPATLFGEGRVASLGAVIADQDIEVVVVDGPLSPVQQRNLEQRWKAKVLDRTGLILEIFAERARTREGRLQVELARLTYQKSRLVRSWTHLERQRGGFGFVGGPGETQIEADRRQIQERITKLERQLERVTRTRELHRKKRREAPYPIVALVGYTNAGKSTLFNQITHASVQAEDMLFATLDPTMRAVTLPSGRKVILSDTVGFVSNLPTHLVAAFRATLEEVCEAEIIVHVRDASHADTQAQAEDVAAVLKSLGLDPAEADNVIEAMNKIDRLAPEERARLENQVGRTPHQVAISGLTGAGVPDLLQQIDRMLDDKAIEVELDIAPADGSSLAWLYQHGRVSERHDEADGSVHVRVALSGKERGVFAKRFPHLAIERNESRAAE